MTQPFIRLSGADYAADDRALAAMLGGKGASLAIMTARLGLPVPPAFTIGVDAFREWRKEGGIAFLEEELRGAIAALEHALKRRFGGDRPLIVSVRSGAPVSMPGMMDTILNLGMTPAVEQALAAEMGAAVASDTYRRFQSMFEKIVGVAPTDDPWAQLRAAIVAVFSSWDSPRAKTYRARGGISDDLGTAVTVQAMVFGTAPGFSGTGVAFTRDPSTGEPVPTGDWLANAQGEDVVAGTHATKPLSALAVDAPEIWSQLLSVLATLEHHYRDLCDVEFTVEAGRLWILQARVGKRSARAAVRIAVDRALDAKLNFDRRDAIAAVAEHEMREALDAKTLASTPPRLTCGIAASPGIVSGRVCLSADAAVDAMARGEKVILVRQETSPADIHGMDAAEGILTGSGGLVSHAAIVAREWGKAAVVGATELSIGDSGFAVGDDFVREGEEITIDGTTGNVFRGVIDHASDAHDPEVSTLLDWAREIAGDRGESLATFAAARASVLAARAGS